MIYKPDHFKLQEFVPPSVFNDRGELAWELLDPRMIATWDELRKRTGKPCTLNNWHSGGPRQWSGLRTAEYYEDMLNHYSQHPLGRAGDGLIHGMTPEEVIFDIIDQKSKGSYPHLTGIEVGCTWVHLDTRPKMRVDKNGLFIFDTKGIVDWETYVWPL